MNVGGSGIETETWLHVLMVGSLVSKITNVKFHLKDFCLYTIVIISENSNVSISCIVY